MGALSAFFLALLGIGILILVHEWGHFWVARRVGLTVQEFSIGVGPSLLRWQGRDGVVYRLRLFFLFAGFVRIVEIEQDLLQKPTSPFARPPKALLRRIAVIFCWQSCSFSSSAFGRRGCASRRKLRRSFKEALPKRRGYDLAMKSSGLRSCALSLPHRLSSRRRCTFTSPTILKNPFAFGCGGIFKRCR
ncbi:MAG: hypothetical protein HZLCBSQH_002299 [Candidatus Fervidibacterota bacterium]